jgi:hypothetical protein
MADILSVYTKHMAKWNSNIPWQKDSSYILRCLEANFGPSKKENPMITFKYEVVSPETFEVAGVAYEIAGVPMKTYQVCQTLEGGVVDVEKTTKNKEALVKLYNAFGLDSTNINPENPDTTGFVGKCVYAMVYNDQQDQRKTPTKAQLDKGIRQGDILLNPITKQPLKSNYPKIGEVFGLAPTDNNKPY